MKFSRVALASVITFSAAIADTIDFSISANRGQSEKRDCQTAECKKEVCFQAISQFEAELKRKCDAFDGTLTIDGPLSVSSRYEDGADTLWVCYADNHNQTAKVKCTVSK